MAVPCLKGLEEYLSYVDDKKTALAMVSGLFGAREVQLHYYRTTSSLLKAMILSVFFVVAVYWYIYRYVQSQVIIISFISGMATTGELDTIRYLSK